MARNLTEDEVKFIEERRKQQAEQKERDFFESKMSEEELGAIDQRRQELQAAGLQKRVSAMGDAARGWRRGQAERDQAERQHWDDMYRQSHGGLSRAEVRNLGPDGSGRQARGIARAAELRAAHERQKDIMGTEDVTRIEEARERRLGMENQGVGAAKLRYGYTDWNGKRVQGSEEIIAGQQAADKEKQRQHELEMQGRTQTFQGAQNTADRQNRLDIAKTQGQSTVDAARAQAAARAADISAKNEIEREKIAARKEIAAMRENGKLTQAGTARLSKTYSGLVAAGYSPARIRALLLDEGWSAEDIAAAQGRGQGQ